MSCNGGIILYYYMSDHGSVIFFVSTGTKCEQPYVPVNGEFICSEEDEGVNCTLHCKDGYSFTHDAVHSYFCAYNGVWEPPYSADRPDCSGKCCTAILLVLLFSYALFTLYCSLLCVDMSHFYKYILVYIRLVRITCQFQLINHRNNNT